MEQINVWRKIIVCKNDDSPKVSESAAKLVQQVVGTLLYYALAIDVTMQVAIG